MPRMRQEELVLHHLQNVGPLSGREAEDLYRIRDLPKRVSQLKREGVEIARRLRTDSLGQRYARYALKANEEALHAEG